MRPIHSNVMATGCMCMHPVRNGGCGAKIWFAVLCWLPGCRIGLPGAPRMCPLGGVFRVWGGPRAGPAWPGASLLLPARCDSHELVARTAHIG